MQFRRLVTFALVAGLLGCGSPPPPPAETRSFRLGFTPFPYDFADGVLEWVYAHLATDGDLIAHHFDNGIPWTDALVDNYPYDPHVMNDWQWRKDHTPSSHHSYVAVTPIALSRRDLAPLRGSGDDMPLPAPFDAHAAAGDFAHPEVKQAFLNYCERVIAFFEPDHLAIGIEVNLLRREAGADAWASYLELHRATYAALKVRHPALPIFVSLAAMPMMAGYDGPPEEFEGAPDPAAAYLASQRAALDDVIETTDYLGLSFYPYASVYHQSDFPEGMADALFALGGGAKPVAIAETGVLAEDVAFESIVLQGTPERQDGYVRTLLDAANRHRAPFIVNFLIRDYDPLCTTLPGACEGAGVVWRDTGFYSEAATPRPALDTWRSWLARSFPFRPR